MEQFNGTYFISVTFEMTKIIIARHSYNLARAWRFRHDENLDSTIQHYLPYRTKVNCMLTYF